MEISVTDDRKATKPGLIPQIPVVSGHAILG